MPQPGINPQTLKVFGKIARTPLAQVYYLAGGTACAIHEGHRLSYDLDFFARFPAEPREIQNTLLSLGDVGIQQNEPGTFNGSLDEIKVSFFVYPYPNLDITVEYEGIKIASPRDLACMKLESISSRGVKRDFIDLYWLAQQPHLITVFEWFKEKYAGHNVSPEHVLKSLIYFVDAENEPMPIMLKPTDWGEVKEYFLKEVPDVARQWGL